MTAITYYLSPAKAKATPFSPCLPPRALCHHPTHARSSTHPPTHFHHTTTHHPVSPLQPYITALSSYTAHTLLPRNATPRYATAHPRPPPRDCSHTTTTSAAAGTNGAAQQRLIGDVVGKK